MIEEDFAANLAPRWKRHLAGSGALESTGSSLRFVNTDTVSGEYTNAQIDDYQDLPRRGFPWRPPLRLVVRARFSHSAGDLQGTAGFGFWNDPFMMTGARFPTLPRAIWFFYGSSPSNIKLDLEVLGHGWKAATIDALRPVAVPLAPLAPLAMLLMKIPAVYRALWPRIQRAVNVKETSLAVEMTAWHNYALDWGEERSTFTVDGDTTMEGAPAPRGPLGFVMWLDNQYMVVTPWGKFRWGTLDTPGRQWMEVSQLRIAPY